MLWTSLSTPPFLFAKQKYDFITDDMTSTNPVIPVLSWGGRTENLQGGSKKDKEELERPKRRSMELLGVTGLDVCNQSHVSNGRGNDMVVPLSRRLLPSSVGFGEA